MSRLRSLAIKTPVHTILRLKQADRGRQNLVYRNQILTVYDSSGKTLDQVRVKNAVSSSISHSKLIKQQLSSYVEQVTKGYNLLIMSLGATGSGKQSLFGNNKNRGLISLLVEEICAECQSKYYVSSHQNLEFFFEIRAIQIFDERVMDLYNSNLPTSCTMKDNVWDGVVLERSTAIKADNYLDFATKLQTAFKNRDNLLNLLSGSTAKTSSIITVSLIQQFKQNSKRKTLCSKMMFAELPGLEVLKDSQFDLRVKEASKSIRGLVAFSSLIRQLSDDNNQVSPLYQVSNLTYALKQFLGSNSFCVAFANVVNQDPAGALKTLSCMKNLVKISQYPIVNNGEAIGLMYRIRTDLLSLKIPQIRQRISQKAIKQQRLMNQNTNYDKIRAQDDYKRVFEKYKQSKSKLQQTIRKKSQLQLLLIRSEQQKLQLSKTLVQIQIQNTKLMQQAQFHQYNLSKKNNKLQSKLQKNQSQKTRTDQNITSLNQYLSKLQEDKRDLQIELVALKKNYLLSQKELQKSRKQTQTIQIDYINLSNENKYLQEQLFKGSKDDRERYQLQQIKKYNDDKVQWMEKQNQYKSQIQAMRRQLLRNSSKNNQQNNMNYKMSRASSKSNNTEQENEKLQMYNRLKLNQRKVDQLQEHLRIMNQYIQQYKTQNYNLSQSLNTTANYYKNKLQQLIANKQGVGLNRQMKQHLTRQNQQNSRRINQLLLKVQALKQKNRGLRIYNIKLRGLLQQHIPKGLSIPNIQQTNINNNKQVQQQQIIRLNNKISYLQSQLSQQRSNKQRSRPVTNQMLKQQLNFLKQSRVSSYSNNDQKIRNQYNELKEENRKLTVMLKDSNKLQIASILKQNQSLKNQIDRIKSKDSVSPVSNDQKLVYYQKHIKKLQKERSQLLVRVTMTEQQLKMYQNHYQKKK